MNIDEAILIHGYCPSNHIPSVVTEIHCLLWDIFNVCSFGVVKLIGWDPKYEPVIISLSGRAINVIEAILLKDKLDMVGVDPAIRVIHTASHSCPCLYAVHVGAWIGVELARNGDFRVADPIGKDALPDLLLHLAVDASIPVPCGVLGVPSHLTVQLVHQISQKGCIRAVARVSAI